MSDKDDDIGYGIIEALKYFVNRYKTDNKSFEVKLEVRYMTPTLMMGVGYLIAKDYLVYRGLQYYRLKDSGMEYYVGLVEEGILENDG